MLLCMDGVRRGEDRRSRLCLRMMGMLMGTVLPRLIRLPLLRSEQTSPKAVPSTYGLCGIGVVVADAAAG